MNRRPKHPRLEKGERRASQSSSQSQQQHGAGTSGEAGTISSLVRRTSSIVDEARRYVCVAIGVRIRRTQQSITDTMAAECVLEVLRFSARDSLEAMQLVSRRFNFFVINVFPNYPLRKIHCLEARTNRQGVYQLQAVCLPETQPSASTPQTVETDDSDLHLWLRNSFVSDRLELTDFFFTRDVFISLCMMDPESVKVKQVILDFRCRPKKMQLQMDLGGERPVTPDQPPINGNDIRMLFNTAFSSCKNVIMCFDRPCGYVPALHECFCLPVDTLILDFKYRLESADDLDLLVVWIHGGSETTRTLCLKRFDLGDTAISQLVAKMRQRFMQDTEPHPFLFKVEKDENVDELWDDNDAWETDMTHPVTGERFVVDNEVHLDEMHISRC